MKRLLSLGISALAVAALSAGWTVAGQAAETKGPVTDDIGVVEIPKDAPIVIGGYWVISGPDTALGLDSKRGVEIAFDDIKNTIAGHAIQFVVEDDRAMPKAARPRRPSSPTLPNIVAVLGPGLLECCDGGGADPVEGRHRRHRHGHDGAFADRGRSQARLFRLYADDLYGCRSGLQRCRVVLQGTEVQDAGHHS